MGPTVQLQYLGIILDTDSMEARLPLDKLTRIREMLHQFESKQRISKRALLSLLDHLNFASRVMRQGRSSLSLRITPPRQAKRRMSPGYGYVA